jgi:hypothetical protein
MRRRGTPPPPGEVIPCGRRHTTLVDLAVDLVRRGVTDPDLVRGALLEVNRVRWHRAGRGRGGGRHRRVGSGVADRDPRAGMQRVHRALVQAAEGGEVVSPRRKGDEGVHLPPYCPEADYPAGDGPAWISEALGAPGCLAGARRYSSDDAR